MVTAGLSLLAAVVYGPHVATDTFFSDDWPNAAVYALEAEPGLRGALAHALERPFFDYRPVAALAIALQHELLGLAPVLHLAMGVAIGVLVSVALFGLLRELALPRAHAAAIAALMLLFPWADAARLWPTASLNGLAVLLWIGGAVVSLRAFVAVGRRAALGHAIAVALYVLAILMYEVAAGFVIAAVVLYALRAPWRSALRRFAVDLGAAATTLFVMAVNTPRAPAPLADQLAHAARIAEESVILLGRAAAPLLRPSATVAALVAVAVAVVVAVALIARGRSTDAAARRELGRWLTVAGSGAVGVAAGYLLIVPAHESFSPLTPGVLSRVNMFAAVGYVTLAYAAAVLLVKVVMPQLPPARRPLGAATAVLAGALGVGYVVEADARMEGWERSAEQQRDVLTAVDRLPPLAPGGVVLSFGAPIHAAPGVPVFRHLELSAAVRLRLDRPDVAAYPMYPETRVVCGGRTLRAEGASYGRRDADTPPDAFLVEAVGRYGAAYMLNAVTGRWDAVGDRAECRSLRAAYRPGPLTAASAP